MLQAMLSLLFLRGSWMFSSTTRPLQDEFAVIFPWQTVQSFDRHEP